MVVVRADLPDSLVYQIAKLLDENRDTIAESIPAFKTFDSSKAIMTGGLKIHPGAEQYYRKKGYIS